ncbi:MAG: winged helix-turn-helix transcriptional regulator [Acholeplasmatales bacterium]|nr:winged helix-turn-helix transcriptional regulator [Acholeplasmatales bacterium]
MKQRYQDFTVLITKISRSIKRIKTFEMEEINLKSPHVSCIYYLYREGGLTAKELCDICEEDKAQISRAIDYLEENEYVYCVENSKKRYKTQLFLTDKGMDAGKFVASKIDNILLCIDEVLKEEERQSMYNSLSKISNCLEDICKKGEE